MRKLIKPIAHDKHPFPSPYCSQQLLHVGGAPYGSRSSRHRASWDFFSLNRTSTTNSYCFTLSNPSLVTHLPYRGTFANAWYTLYQNTLYHWWHHVQLELSYTRTPLVSWCTQTHIITLTTCGLQLVTEVLHWTVLLQLIHKLVEVLRIQTDHGFCGI